ncbi:MerR family transcriptional regulator [Xanthomonas theicola]|uniref:HTH merR-type domain-containing protein n=1 Tax=Xanthomonas theicola TaxID=56464 RepID=A0A2S6ZM03_9XANT|nr:MerR family transcriptional regulator [Xanthomonas theicola]PPT93312.1 hypothetical protein XthCFBP4691_00055 [Xanthomonas theicola]QNH24535.1 MerR family transcriptional regulator [Xanthomonas theicola]
MKTYAISEVAARLGLSAHALRYYERAGLLDPVTRVAGRRRYAETDLAWIRFIQRLRATGMPMRQIGGYAQLRRQGEASVDARLALLQEHLQRLAVRESELVAHRAALTEKIEVYRRMQRSAVSNSGKGERK